ncbi:uncharacterized protein [Cherax quadricarinatus]|uniref:uncharacterized protein isoform X2 n=1 Tax=Cherax quadricarinatus TaxID=27406 RepID=UPI00387E50B6
MEAGLGTNRTVTCSLAVMLLLRVAGCAEGVRIRALEVPLVALQKDEVRLRCDYEDEGGSSLYTLKWYKDGREFYRHQPGISPHTPDHRCLDRYSYHVDGVSVDCWVSSEREVVLREVTTTTSGEYQCEVIGEHPKFRKEVRSARLTVFTEALREPRILGAKESYRAEDSVLLNCSSTNTQYLPVLSWTLNDTPVSKRHVRSYEGGRILGLQLQVSRDLFQQGVISLTCTSTLGSLHTRSTQVTLPNPDYLHAEEYYYNAGVQKVCRWTNESLLLVLMLLFPVHLGY